MPATITFVIWGAYLFSLYFVVFWLLVLLEGGLKEERKRLKRTPLVSVIVPAYNEEKSIGNTLNSILNLNYPKDKLEILVINDGSTDNTKGIVERIIKNHPSFNIQLVNKENGGKGTALNLGLEKAKGEFFVCLDADSEPEPDCLIKMLPYFEDGKVATVLPLLKVKNPKKLIEKIQWVEYLINLFYKKLMGHINCVHVSPGPFSAYRTDILRKVGGFDENNLTEDLEITLRLQKYDYRIIQLLNVEVLTKAPNSLKAFYKQRNRWYKGTILNMINYRKMIFNKKYGDFGLVMMPWVMIAGFFTVALFFVSLYHFGYIPLKQLISNWNAINFDLTVYFNTFSWDGVKNFIFNINYINFSLGVLGLGLAVTSFVWAYHAAGEKLRTNGTYLLPVYVIIYSWFIATAWTLVLFDLARGKRQKW